RERPEVAGGGTGDGEGQAGQRLVPGRGDQRLPVAVGGDAVDRPGHVEPGVELPIPGGGGQSGLVAGGADRRRAQLEVGAAAVAAGADDELARLHLGGQRQALFGEGGV